MISSSGARASFGLGTGVLSPSYKREKENRHIHHIYLKIFICLSFMQVHLDTLPLGVRHLLARCQGHCNQEDLPIAPLSKSRKRKVSCLHRTQIIKIVFALGMSTYKFTAFPDTRLAPSC